MTHYSARLSTHPHFPPARRPILTPTCSSTRPHPPLARRPVLGETNQGINLSPQNIVVHLFHRVIDCSLCSERQTGSGLFKKLPRSALDDDNLISPGIAEHSERNEENARATQIRDTPIYLVKIRPNRLS